MEIKNVMRSITPSLSVMVIGLVGAYFVYNVYFADRVASDFAGYEPAAGEQAVMDDAMAADAIGDVATEEEMTADTEVMTDETMVEDATAVEGEAVVEDGVAVEDEAAMEEGTVEEGTVEGEDATAVDAEAASDAEMMTGEEAPAHEEEGAATPH